MSVGQRPGGRSARVRAAVLAAARDLLSEGYANLSVERIAQAAGVNKTTVYRRWTDLEGVLGDLLSESAAQVVPIPDTGDLGADLAALAQLVRRGMTGDNGGLVKALATAAPRNPRAAQVVRDFFAERFGLAQAVIDNAVARGDVPPDTDARAAIEFVGAPFFLRLLVVDAPIDEEFARRAALAATAAVRAGAFSPAAPRATAAS
ncbi:MAG: TetR/AcrR family transcriptional regulator [Hamadaea sp.]|nr:TetR/AcrR family transcriptional regulator [Hamadaea sp.]